MGVKSVSTAIYTMQTSGEEKRVSANWLNQLICRALTVLGSREQKLMHLTIYNFDRT